jgi:predicted ATPase/class 3 adenylate cyclase
LEENNYTFLLINIKNGSSLWEKAPQRAQQSIVRYDGILKEIIAFHGGKVFKIIDHSTYAIFSEPKQAWRASLACQQALFQQKWEQELSSLKVAMALHCGPGLKQADDYQGAVFNQGLALLEAAHGGQILASQAVRDLLWDGLDEPLEMIDLGCHRLKDLTESKNIYQVWQPDLPTDFPPPLTLDIIPHNLPVLQYFLVGRDQEQKKIDTMLHQPGNRLVTLTGPGGVGKTRLGLQVAANMAQSFPDGVFFLDLSTYINKDQVILALAQVLNIEESLNYKMQEEIKQQLKTRQVLLLMDNFENVLEARYFINWLLETSSGLKIIVTSRQPLQLFGEHEFLVPPLALPDFSNLPPLNEIIKYPALELFVQKARAQVPTFNLTAENSPIIAEICGRLDGLPLGIELVAPKVASISPAEILENLKAGMSWLDTNSPDLPRRQQTLWNTISWGYNLLAPQERLLFNRLAVFSGEFSLEAVEDICCVRGNDPENLEFDTELVLGSLESANFVKRTQNPSNGLRFKMLETLREYALEQLEIAGEAYTFRLRHVIYYQKMTEEWKGLSKELGQLKWLELLELEHSNIQAALAFGLKHEDPELFNLVLCMAGNLQKFWLVKGYTSLASKWLEAILALAEPFKLTCNPHFLAKTLKAAGVVAAVQGNNTQAETWLKEALTIYHQINNLDGIADALNNLGNIALGQGNYYQAKAILEECLLLRRKQNNRQGICSTLNNLGIIANCQGDFSKAEIHLQEAISLACEIEDKLSEAYALFNLGQSYLFQQRIAPGFRFLRQSLEININLGNKTDIAECLAGLGVVAVLYKQPFRAVQFYSLASHLQEETGLPVDPVYQALFDRYWAAARNQLDEKGFEQAFREGQAMSVEEALALILDLAANALIEEGQ